MDTTQIMIIVVIASSIWVLADSVSIGVKRGQIKGMLGMGPFGWFIGCLILWLIVFPLYLAKRSELKRINRKEG